VYEAVIEFVEARLKKAGSLKPKRHHAEEDVEEEDTP